MAAGQIEIIVAATEWNFSDDDPWLWRLIGRAVKLHLIYFVQDSPDSPWYTVVNALSTGTEVMGVTEHEIPVYLAGYRLHFMTTIVQREHNRMHSVLSLLNCVSVGKCLVGVYDWKILTPLQFLRKVCLYGR